MVSSLLFLLQINLHNLQNFALISTRADLILSPALPLILGISGRKATVGTPMPALQSQKTMLLMATSQHLFNLPRCTRSPRTRPHILQQTYDTHQNHRRLNCVVTQKRAGEDHCQYCMSLDPHKVHYILAADPRSQHEIQYGYWQPNLKEKCLFGPKSDEQVKPASVPEKTAGNCAHLMLQGVSTLHMSNV